MFVEEALGGGALSALHERVGKHSQRAGGEEPLARSLCDREGFAGAVFCRRQLACVQEDVREHEARDAGSDQGPSALGVLGGLDQSSLRECDFVRRGECYERIDVRVAGREIRAIGVVVADRAQCEWKHDLPRPASHRRVAREHPGDEPRAEALLGRRGELVSGLP